MIIKDIKDRYILVYSDQLLSTYKHCLIFNPELSESENIAKQSEALKKILDFKKTTYCLNSASFSLFNESWNVTEELQKTRENIDKITKEDSELNTILHGQVNLYEYRFFNKAFQITSDVQSPQKDVAPFDYKMSKEAFTALSGNFLDFFKHFPDIDNTDVLNAIKTFKADEKASLYYFKKLPKKYQSELDVCSAFVNRFRFFQYEKASIPLTILENPHFVKTLLNKSLKNLVHQPETFKNYETIKKMLPLNFEAYSNLLSLDETSYKSKEELYKSISKNYSREDCLEHILLDASSITFFLNIPDFKIDIPVITRVFFGHYSNEKDADKTLSILFRFFQTKNITFNDIETSEILEMLLEKEAFEKNKFFYSSTNFALLTQINPKIKEMYSKLVDEQIEQSINLSRQIDISSKDFIEKISSELCQNVMLEDLQHQEKPKTKYKTVKF